MNFELHTRLQKIRAKTLKNASRAPLMLLPLIEDTPPLATDLLTATEIALNEPLKNTTLKCALLLDDAQVNKQMFASLLSTSGFKYFQIVKVALNLFRHVQKLERHGFSHCNVCKKCTY